MKNNAVNVILFYVFDYVFYKLHYIVIVYQKYVFYIL